MSRRVVAVCLALALAGDATVMGQRRAVQRRAPQAAAPAPAPVSPGPAASDSGFRSSLTFRAKPAEPPRPPAPRRGSVFPVFPFLWGWDTIPAGVDATAMPKPLSEDAPAGGVQLDVQPWRACVFVDGVYVGRVEDFNGYYRHLSVPAGPHQVVILESGYEPLVIDVVVRPGQTATYRGTLSR